MMKNFLDEIIAAKRKRLIHEGARVTARPSNKPHRFRQALAADDPPVKIIAEFKRRSPSAGRLLERDVSPADIARAYEQAGACALSILTEEDYFAGSIADLIAVRAATKLPLLRKDFIIDEAQLFEAADAGADAVLLIAAALETKTLARLRAVTEEQLQLDALVEVHNEAELEHALEAGATLIGVNNRNLQTFNVSLGTSERLIAHAPSDCLFVSESGLRTWQDIDRLRQLGYRAFLIGETFIRADDPGEALTRLLHAE